MSRSRQRVDTLRQISRIRAITAKLAEAKCVAVNRKLAIAEEKQQLKQDHLCDAVEGWEGAMKSAYFDPESTAAWGHAINRAVSDVDAATSDAVQCGIVLKQARQHMAGTIADERCADALLSKAWKKHINGAENEHLTELADQITRKGVRR